MTQIFKYWNTLRVYIGFEIGSNQNQILIRKDLWNDKVVAPLDKAALVWHEVIYSWLRANYQDTNSVRARQVVGILFSTLPIPEMRKKIQDILTPSTIDPNKPYWFCMTINQITFLYFGEYGASELEAKTKVVQKCSQEAMGVHCGEYGTRCEEILNPSNKSSCQLKNYLTAKTYFAQGNGLLEAEFKVRDLCIKEKLSNPVHCNNQPVCY